MRLVFLLALFLGALFYSRIAFFDLPFLTRTGRLGPGFFPRLLGAGLLVLTLWSLVEEFLARRRMAGGPETGAGNMGRAVAAMIALGAGLLAGIEIFGGIVGSMIFLAAALTVFNAGDHLRNALVAIGMPLAIYLLFNVVLNAETPRGLLPMPF